MLSQAVEDYLKSIYKLQDDGPVSTTDIARSLNVSSASVTSMAKRLNEMGLVNHRSYRGVTLTKAGEKIALEIIRHHRLLETYLKEVMGYGWEEMHAEAEHLEHHISEAFEKRIDALLGYPTRDPHGDPIPASDGTIEKVEGDPLSDLPAGAEVIVQRVPDDDPTVLDYLEQIGILPNARIRILDHAPLNGPITVSVQGETRILGADLAAKVFAAAAAP